MYGMAMHTHEGLAEKVDGPSSIYSSSLYTSFARPSEEERSVDNEERFTSSGGPSHHIARSYRQCCSFDRSCVNSLSSDAGREKPSHRAYPRVDCVACMALGSLRVVS
jgi:hypothetical protein